MKTIAELKKLSDKDFRKELAKAAKEKMKLKFEARTGQLAGAHLLRNAKKYVARVKTIGRMRDAEAAAKKTETKKAA